LTYLALDPSKSNTGWAQWTPGRATPIYGSVCLGTSYTPRPQVLTKLRQTLIDLFSVEPFDFIFVEQAINLNMNHNTSPDNIRMAERLMGTIEGVSFELRVRKIYEYEPREWQPGFCGRDEHRLIKRAAKQAQRSARDPIKAAVQEMCRIYGLKPRDNDQADAIGILTHGLLAQGIQPPWLADEVLRAPFEARA
jgi:Holliday junction resolvasome RuvABC endonuclease subunit